MYTYIGTLSIYYESQNIHITLLSNTCSICFSTLNPKGYKIHSLKDLTCQKFKETPSDLSLSFYSLNLNKEVILNTRVYQPYWGEIMTYLGEKDVQTPCINASNRFLLVAPNDDKKTCKLLASDVN